MKYQATIGLEIHAELRTKTKMFCACKNDPDEKEPNKNICPVCLAHPGALPTINKEAVKKVLKTGLALNCKIAEYSQFDRKNYFYPDLPKGYQISQYKYPLCGPGYLEIKIPNKHTKQQSPTQESKKIRITRIHLEEDTARLIHPQGQDYSLVDFNRAGVPLMELVTEPDFNTGIEAKVFCEDLQLILRYLKVSYADMEKGQMRCEVNISLAPKSTNKKEKLGTKVEVKNLNSFKAVEKAIDYEIKRQSQLLEAGKKIIQETRGWDEKLQKTVSQRIKEESHDYRYFPEPDLPPLYISHNNMPKHQKKNSQAKISLAEIRRGMPELPQHKRSRLRQEYFLPLEQVEIFVKNKELGEYFEKVASELQEWVKEAEIKETLPQATCKKLYSLAANYLITELQKLTKESENEKEIEKITGENFAELIKMVYKKEINSSAAQRILKIMYQKGGDPSQVAEEHNLLQVSDSAQLEDIINKVIQNNPVVVKDYQSGKENALQFLVGQVMKESRGQANPQVAYDMLRTKLTN